MTIQDEKHHIGIDVSKAILDVYILPCKKYMQFRNDPKDIRKLIKKLLAFSSVSVVMEPREAMKSQLPKDFNRQVLEYLLSIQGRSGISQNPLESLPRLIRSMLRLLRCLQRKSNHEPVPLLAKPNRTCPLLMHAGGS